MILRSIPHCSETVRLHESFIDDAAAEVTIAHINELLGNSRSFPITITEQQMGPNWPIRQAVIRRLLAAGYKVVEVSYHTESDPYYKIQEGDHHAA